MRRIALLLLTLAACTKEDPKPAAATTPSATVEPAPSAPVGQIETAALPTSSVAVPPKPGYATHVNTRYGFTVDYPTFIKLEPPPDSRDGQSFTYFDKISMKAWAMHNVGNDTLDTLAKNAAKEHVDPKDDPKKAITYQQKTKDGFVLSGTRGSKIFYRKERLVGGIAYAVLLEYDAAMKAEMDPIVTHVAESFVVMGPPKK